LATLITASALLFSTAEAQESPEPTPTAVISQQNVAIGDVVDISGDGWPPGSLVVIEVCGCLGAGGSLDRAVPTPERGVDRDGRFRIPVMVTAPPTPCPCAVIVTGLSGTQPLVLPLTIEGVPVEPGGESAPAPALVVEAARLEGSGPWTAWFGAHASRTFVLTVRNTGAAPADARLTLVAGPGDNPHGWVSMTQPGRLDPGERNTLRTPVRFDPLGFGRHVVAGEIAAPGTEVPFQVGTSIHPWRLYAVALVGLGAIVAATFTRLRRRGTSSAKQRTCCAT
jgi:hypothetical protein